MTRTPEEDALLQARLMLAGRGYTFGDVIEYEEALALLKEAILKDKK